MLLEAQFMGNAQICFGGRKLKCAGKKKKAGLLTKEWASLLTIMSILF
jgi:hypothetical protein